MSDDTNINELRAAPRLFAQPLTRVTAGPAMHIDPGLILNRPTRIPRPATPAPAPTPAPPVAPTLPAPPAPTATETVFEQLPFPSAGDRIRAEDFRKLSQALTTVADAFALSSGLLGRTYGEARMFLTAQQYVIERVLTVFGMQVDATDTSLDGRTVLSVAPVQLGDRRVAVVLSEAVDTRRFAPDLSGLTYREATERVRSLVGDAMPGAPAIPAPNVVGLSVDAAASAVVR